MQLLAICKMSFKDKSLLSLSKGHRYISLSIINSSLDDFAIVLMKTYPISISICQLQKEYNQAYVHQSCRLNDNTANMQQKQRTYQWRIQS